MVITMTKAAATVSTTITMIHLVSGTQTDLNCHFWGTNVLKNEIIDAIGCFIRLTQSATPTSLL